MHEIKCSGWEEIFGQDQVVAYLRSGLQRGDLPHALLFTGPRGVGKFSTALLLAAAFLCPYGGPDGCPACRRVADRVHPDLHLVGPEGLSIRVEQIRKMESALSRKPVEGRGRVVIVDEADSMTQEAANALLKTLEEPNPDTELVLVCESRENLLPTVVSRCREIRFSPLGSRDLERFLAEREGVAEEEARSLARRAGGIFGRALLWVRHPELALYWKRGVECAASMRRLSLQEALESMEACRRQLHELKLSAGGQDDPYLAALDRKSAEQLRKRREEEMARENKRARRQAARDFLDGMGSFYRDIMLLNLVEEEGGEVSEELLLNPEWRRELEREALHMDHRRAWRCLEALREAERSLDANVDEELVFAGLVLELRSRI